MTKILSEEEIQDFDLILSTQRSLKDWEAAMLLNSHEALRKRVEEMKVLLKKVKKFYEDELDAIGGCDHSVGICCCSDYQVLEEILETIK